ncbi:sugar transferase [Planctomonas psychrotolerans]|uniref:sugar transferase n=1 Tax=Planctomonas psychrotolerans TaxID=2528712 RepID=UPI00123B2F39|nr:sugar transferase [Planctomonas psychrotolerans]
MSVLHEKPTATATPPLRSKRRAEPRFVDTLAAPSAPNAPSPGSTWARRYRNKLLITDTVIILAAVVLSFFLRFGVPDTYSALGAFPADYGTISAVIVVTWLCILGAYRTRDARVLGIGVTEYKRVVNASAWTFGLLAIAFLILGVQIARGFFIVALPLGLAGLALSRWLWRQWLTRQRQYGHYLSRAIVVGEREDVEYVVGQIHRKSGAAYQVVGTALDGDPTGCVTIDSLRIPVVSDLSRVARAAASLGADVVIVAGQPSAGNHYIRNLGWDLEGTNAELVVASRLTNIAGPRIHFRPVEGLPLMHVELPQYEGGKHVLKRLFDMAVSGGALLVLSPLLLVLAVIVRVDSPGPVLFRQERVGRNGRTFHMLKFRSMVETAEDDLASLLDRNEGAGILFKIKNDPRITRAGKTLRKYSLDELPQLWNILVGDMSLVGPRPPLQREVLAYESHVHRRLYIKPGLTGMWQVNGRSNLSWEESVRLDLYYVENWSLTGDLMIIWRTFRVLLKPIGAF